MCLLSSSALLMSALFPAGAAELPDALASACPAPPEGSPACADRGGWTCVLRSSECDSNPAAVLPACLRTCSVCLPGGVSGPVQNSGTGRAPAGVSVGTMSAARRANLYYLERTSARPPSPLTGECRESSPLCAFWAYKGHCDGGDDDEHAEHVRGECPLSCRTCELSEAWAFLNLLHGELSEAYDAHGTDYEASRRASLALFAAAMGADSFAPGRRYAGTNWLVDLHARTEAAVPPSLAALFPTDAGPVSDADFRTLAGLHDVPPGMDPRDALPQMLEPYRARGYVVRALWETYRLIIRPVQLAAGFAVPGAGAVERIVRYPLLQMGAGTGYWAAVLRDAGADVLAYDPRPPEQGENAFFDAQYTDIEEGACRDVLEGRPQAARERTLLLVWPNDPDPADQPYFCGDDCTGSEATWDVDCLRAYLDAGGGRVVFVGERAATVPRTHGGNPDGGLSATRAFQDLLEERFDLVDTVPVPRWWLNEDDLTVWERRGSVA